MRKAVIFDFKRTLYDPDSDRLLPGTKSVLGQLKERGYSLFLISHGSFPRDLIAKFGLDSYFDEILITENKSVKDFRKIISDNDVNPEVSFVVGDRIRGEIRIGNGLGLRTVWLKKGRFAQELPIEKIEKPNFLITELKEVLQHILQI